jgi:hypothetical protein
MPSRPAGAALALLPLFWIGPALAQQAGDLSIRIEAPHPFYQGELIGAEIRFPGQKVLPGGPPPAEMWQFAGFLLDPAIGCGAAATPCGLPSRLVGHPPPIFQLGQGTDTVRIWLNQYLSVLRPGRYRVSLLMRKLARTNGRSFLYAEPPRYMLSDSAGFEVVAAPREWVRNKIAASAAILKGPEPQTRDAYEKRTEAAWQLRSLDLPAAWRTALGVLPAEESVLIEGLTLTRDPAPVCRLMRDAVPAPAQAVSTYYLWGLAEICVRAEFPPPPSSDAPDRQKAYWKRRGERQQEITSAAADVLAASLAGKQGVPKAVAFQTLIDRVQQIRNNPGQAEPEWLPAVKAELLRSYAGMEALQKRHLLAAYASTLRSPDLIPLLESTVNAWKPGDYYEAPREALRYLYAIDPQRALDRIVAELGVEKTWLFGSDLDMLPAPSAAGRITDNQLIDALAAAQRPGGWYVELRMAAVARYATPKALPRIRAIFESQQQPCQPELMAYFLRVDPAYAGRVFHSHPWDMHAEPPPCTVQYFSRTPQIAMGRPLEEYMVAYLMHSSVPVKKAAADALGRYGSPAAAAPLWAAFRYFHEYWNGKQTELDRNGEGVYLEIALRDAIARGSNWLATEADLGTVESLCISQRCIYATRQDLQAWHMPLGISLDEGMGEIRARVAQYYGIGSIEALEAKLAQFPKGTGFVLAARGASEGNARRVREYGSRLGLKIQ